jgi:exodeoxyribonuclease-5
MIEAEVTLRVDEEIIERTQSESWQKQFFKLTPEEAAAHIVYNLVVVEAEEKEGLMASTSDKKLTVADLSPDQREVYESILEWTGGEVGMKNPFDKTGGSTGLLTCGGYAGSGKSTLLGVFASTTDLHVAYAAFTGRAASILERKLKACGVKTSSKPFMDAQKMERSRFAHLFSSDPNATYCGTIHRLLYRPVINSKDELVGFQKRDQLDRSYDLIVVDEASMVGDEMLVDLKQHGVPILAVGDHGQLPPVQQSGSLMQNPMLRLEKIHRQAADSPVIQLAHLIREGGRFKDFKGWNDDVRKLLKTKTDDVLTELGGLESGVLCWTNKTRVALNARARKALGFSGPPKKGEILICLRNMPPVFNGMRGVLLEDSQMNKEDPSDNPFKDSREWILRSRLEFPDEGVPADTYTMCSMQFNREKTLGNVDEVNEQYGLELRSMKEAGSLFDFGYVLTTHKSQGSSFEHAVFYVDRPEAPDQEDWRRWAYTAVTRSSKRLSVLTGG